MVHYENFILYGNTTILDNAHIEAGKRIKISHYNVDSVETATTLNIL